MGADRVLILVRIRYHLPYDRINPFIGKSLAEYAKTSGWSQKAECKLTISSNVLREIEAKVSDESDDGIDQDIC